MSCSRNRRRPKVSSIFHSRLHNQHESSLINTQSSEKIHQLSRRRKSNHPGNLSKQILHENTIDFDRFRVIIVLIFNLILLFCLKILDDKGNDVTPRPITDYVRINIQNRREDDKSITETANKRIIENQEPSVSDKSIVGTTSLTTSTSHMAHTGTVFSAG
jgi:hypothetical protein